MKTNDDDDGGTMKKDLKLGHSANGPLVEVINIFGCH